MEFLTLQFYLFLLAVLIIYYILPLDYRWYALLSGSLAFYWYISECSKKKFGMLILASFLCWGLTLLMRKAARYKKFLFN